MAAREIRASSVNIQEHEIVNSTHPSRLKGTVRGPKEAVLDDGFDT